MGYTNIPSKKNFSPPGTPPIAAINAKAIYPKAIRDDKNIPIFEEKNEEIPQITKNVINQGRS